MARKQMFVRWFETLGSDDVARVGGKNASLNTTTSKGERQAFVLQDDEILQLARWACVIE
jgi:phosphoenolpyruvate synthase/pyruvate phosphate dikinase